MHLPNTVLGPIKDHLEAEKKKIEGTLLSLKSQDPFTDPDRLNDNAASDTEANEESSHERFEALEKEMKQHLDEITQALSRIDHGTYGTCIQCKQLIDTDRLAIKPTALYCVNCERQLEH
jgi:DnaK suppressor protein